MANVFDNITGVKHCVAESSLLKATEVGHIYSLRCHEDMDNGSIVCVGNWVEAQVYASKDYTEGEHPVFVLTPPIGYNSDRREYQEEQYFYNAKDEIARAYELHVGDIFTVSEVIFGEGNVPAVGKFIDASYTVSESAGEGFVGEIVEKVIYSQSVSYRIAVRSLGV